MTEKMLKAPAPSRPALIAAEASLRRLIAKLIDPMMVASSEAPAGPS
jgi:hypothetical protein